MKGLDLRRLKKISSDDKTTLFKHDNGHELKIAHAGLSPKMLSELQSLPMRGQKPQKMANGGPPEPQPQPNASPDDSDAGSKPQAPVTINIGGQPQPQAQGVPVPAPYTPGVSAPGPQATTGLNPQNPPPDQSAPAPQSPAAPDAGQADQPDEDVPAPQQNQKQAQQAPDQSQGLPPDTRTELNQEDAAWAHDLANGHITPKTYQDLFSKNADGTDRGTLSKIGMMFGLMVSGAGAGLSHQPNMLLGMMNNEIQNDLEAQKQSKVNAQNFVRLNQQHQMNQAQIGLLGAQAKNTQIEASSRAYALANMQANRATVQHLTDQVKKYPVGSPQRAQAEQTLAMVSQAVNNENFRIADQAAARSALLQQMGVDVSGAAAGQAPQGADTASQLRKMQALGFIDKEQYNKANEELKLVQNKQQANQGALDSFDKVSNLVTAGHRALNPIQSGKQISAEWDPMLDKLTKSNEGRVTPITVEMMNGIKPAMGDSAETTNIKRQKLNEILNAGYSTPTLDGLKLTPQNKASGEVRYDAQGNAWKMGPNGKPVRVK